jgi:hypothetical protein
MMHFVDIKLLSYFYLKQRFWDWIVHLFLGKKPTQMGPIDRASPYLQTHFLLGTKHYDKLTV